MTDQFSNKPRDGHGPATIHSFIRDRLEVAGHVYDARTLAGLKNADIQTLFPKLIDDLSSSRKQYDWAQLRARDEIARQRAVPTLPTEPAQRNYRIGREDEWKPSRLEVFFLNLLTQAEWQEVSGSVEAQADKNRGSGALSLRSVVEQVLSDEPRTRKFVEAVRDTVRKFHGAPRVYDVGCGPFPILAITAALESPESEIHCIEINPLSATIAEKIIAKLGLSDQIKIHRADALSAELPPSSSIDILISETVGAGLMDEQITRIMPRYAQSLSEKGVTIPSHVNISGAVVPLDKGISTREGTSKYKFVLNVNSEYLPLLSRSEWHTLTDEETIDLRKPVERIEGSIPIPEGIPLKDLATKHWIAVSLELTLDPRGRHTLNRYQSAPTSPLNLSFIKVPSELIDEDPKNLEIRFSFIPGEKSDVAGRSDAFVARKATS